MRCLLLCLCLSLIQLAHAQWIVQQSHTNADLRGIHTVGGGVAWASGTNGVVLRTTDDGRTWQACSVPPGAEKLDFRGIQAFDPGTAIVMSSGPGDLSRIYRTTDGCRTWKLVFTNPDKEGFWDALQFSGRDAGTLMGDPVGGQFPIFSTTDGGMHWQRLAMPAIAAEPNQSIFAASNTSMLTEAKARKLYFVTGGGVASFFEISLNRAAVAHTPLPLRNSASAGAFSLAVRPDGSKLIFVSVGGDYKSPNDTTGTAAGCVYAEDCCQWRASDVSPHGYRSAVMYDAAVKSWIAVGPNGTDFSVDDARTWRPMKPAGGESPDADRNWNALSLPLVVGPGGRIGKFDGRR